PSQLAYLPNVSSGLTLFGTVDAHTHQAYQAFLAQQLLSAQQARPAQHLSQVNSAETLLLDVFSTMTLDDPTWTMDTQGDGITIPITNTGHNIPPTLNRPFYFPVNQAQLTPPSPVAQTNPTHPKQPLPTTHTSTLTTQHQQSVTTSHSLTPTCLSHMAHSPTHNSPTISAQYLPTLTHPMVTRAQVGTIKCNHPYNFHTSHVSPLPKSPYIALSDPNWCATMYDEYNVLVKNSTWMLVPKPPNVNVVRSMWLFRHKYHADGSLSRHVPNLEEIYYAALERAHMISCNFSWTPVDTESKLVPDGYPVLDPLLYRSLTSGLQYLTFTHPDISYVVQHICLYMHDPREPYLAALKRILRYVHGNNIPSWSSKGQSGADLAETTWIRNLLWELHSPLLSVTLVYCDNVRILHALLRYLYADIFTNGLPSALFKEFCTSLSVRSSLASTAGGVSQYLL
ncbi:ribonuclease H-like domain-containing protein, partial [Tanacetum coccineum]